ncbi:beta-amyrin 24-hydroxylase-like [Syzygium oleosum]|uniref:beta-amyrin 24-hydroxylase-like n=1 Tax=Syzygium oleosum TaxID=219896 RepID=UPI0011D2ADC3|nr:beta-amyrin 24-hydroxylase-like [Syzygium oleosum]
MAVTNLDLTRYTFYLTIFITSCFLLRALFARLANSSSRQPPSPPLSLPVIGHIYLLGSSLPKSFQTLARRYGPLMRIRMGASTYLVASDAAVAKEILKTHDAKFSSRFEMGPVQYSIYKQTGFMTAPYGPYYRFMKRLCLTRLFAGSQLDQFRHILKEEVERLVRSVSECSGEGRSCDLTGELTTLSNNIIFRMIMSKRYSKFVEEARELRRLVVEIMELGAKLGVSEVFGPLKWYDLFGHGRRLTEAMRRYDGVLEKVLRDYEENIDEGGESDLLEMLLESCGDGNAEVEVTRDHIKHFVFEMLMASIDTMSAALQWAMANLINHRAVFKKLRDEIESAVGPAKLVGEPDTQNLPYLHAVAKETLRLHTPTPLIFRECSRDCKVMGYDVKAGTRLLMNVYAIMRDPEAWRDPDAFVPERFLVNPSEGGSQLDQIETRGRDFSYLPFGGGRRGCIGASHASMVVQVVVGALTQCFDWEVNGGQKVDINVGSGFSGAMASPLVCRPITHFDPFK